MQLFDPFSPTQRSDACQIPLASLCFVAPLLVIYEAGILVYGPEAARNGCDLWLRQCLEGIGFGQYFLLPLATAFLLLAWHHITRAPWSFPRMVIIRMAWESLVFAWLLLIISQSSAWQTALTLSESQLPDAAVVSTPPTAVWLGFLGAGIYEEMLFRLLLIPALSMLLLRCGETYQASLATAVVISSALFAAAHYAAFTGVGEDFRWSTFGFRFTAGVLFAILFLGRGFGVAAGSHVLYDMLATATD
jgi:membrane protease YdiL (CAAX protease family)